MRRIITILTLLCMFSSIHAQLDSVIVEKYYVSDAKDARDIVRYIKDKQGNIIDSVFVPEGSVTYRVFVSLAAGYKIVKLYGDKAHLLSISSTENFFNHTKGSSFGVSIYSGNLAYGTAALDTWLTLGQATQNYSGVLKDEDTDGSIIGGAIHNTKGMLVNNDTKAGKPLITSDGLDTTTFLDGPPQGWQSVGFKKNNKDSTIFGSLKVENQFISDSSYISCYGVSGVKPNSNKVLIAQLTTNGELSFKLNIEVMDANDKYFSYVADSVLGDFKNGNIYNRYLTYPRLKVCGCNNPDYMEYKPISEMDCIDNALCVTKIKYGCGDPYACNYDPTATYTVPSLCCYPGSCANRDISKVCPDLGGNVKAKVLLYPNPVKDQVTLEINDDSNSETRIEMYNSYGSKVMIKNLGVVSGTVTSPIDVSGLENGMYLVRFFVGDHYESKTFIKAK